LAGGKKILILLPSPTGIFGANPETVKTYVEGGYTLIAVGIDTMIFGEAAKKIADASR